MYPTDMEYLSGGKEIVEPVTVCSKQFCDTEEGFEPAYRSGSYVLCNPCYDEELADDMALSPWRYEHNDTPSLEARSYLS